MSKSIIYVVSILIAGAGTARCQSLPTVLPVEKADLVQNDLRNEAMLKFAELVLPRDIKELKTYRRRLKKKIIEKTGIVVYRNLPLDMQETGTIQLNGYRIKNISYQSRPGIYVTASLYIPDGDGPFPAVITMCGHSTNGRLYDKYQSLGHTLALNGYVCLLVDPWGGGERTTVQGTYEYHGGYLGASLMDVGESLMGLLLTDNIRGVDLLCSLSYVDKKHIGATGSSGGGNQTMWLAAIDERISAAVPVVSVGTFESCVMRSNCICELLPDGLTFTETAGVLSLIAPRPLKMCNHQKDGITFHPAEMMRSYDNVKQVYQLYGKPDDVAYSIFDLTHGYWPEDREVMLGWFDLYLKGEGNGAPKKEIPYQLLPDEKTLTYQSGKRPGNIVTTAVFCKMQGEALRKTLLDTEHFDVSSKRKELVSILRIDESVVLKECHHYTPEQGWERIALETTGHRLIPVLHKAPAIKGAAYAIICSSKGKDSISSAMLNELKQLGMGIVVVELSATGELSTVKEPYYDFHTVARADLWLGKTMLGEWVKELDVVSSFVQSAYEPERLIIQGVKEAGLSALFLNALKSPFDEVTMVNCPVSYLFDNREHVGYFTMGIHLPGIMKWGDVSLAAALSARDVIFVDPVSMSGTSTRGDLLKACQREFDQLRKICRQPGKTSFYFNTEQ